MSVAEAVQFINYTRVNADAREAVAALKAPVAGGDLVQIGRAHGFAFSGAELREAFRIDWTMRYLRYHGRPEDR